MNCPHCGEAGGFHSGRCYDYDVHDDLTGPGNSQAFMTYLRARLKERREIATGH